MPQIAVKNLYVHFPFCRRKCTYCALHSHAVSANSPELKSYPAFVANAIKEGRVRIGGSGADEICHTRDAASPAKSGEAAIVDLASNISTVYFGGGSPALCDLKPLFKELPVSSETEFTVELHPLDVTRDKLLELRDGGVNRISMGVQSLDNATLAKMGRGYTADEAARAFALVRAYFENAGIDLIIGYPGDSAAPNLYRLRDWGLSHCSVYSLILEERSILAHQKSLALPDDDTVLDEVRCVAEFLKSLGLERYEISNYALPGRECRHNLATWKGEDYLGIGEGAFSRIGRFRIENLFSPNAAKLPRTCPTPPSCCAASLPRITEVPPETDRKERTLFRLRTRYGLEARDFPEWPPILSRFVAEGLLTQEGTIFRLTERGTEVCDSILAELV